MRRRALFVVIAGFLTLSLAGASHGWQGRMAGMGDPFGLVADESDFLIHPSGIAEGKGVHFYGNYRFNWQEVSDWSYTMKQFDIATGALIDHLAFRTSGDEQKHDTLVGAALPFGPGRLGVFFQYTGGSGDFHGHAGQTDSYTFDNDLDAFALKALYGLPAGSFKVGGEVQLAYQEAKNSDVFDITSQVFTNDVIGAHIPFLNTFPFQFPYDSKWWEMLFRGSLEGPLGPGKLSLTGRGGFIISGDNDLDYRNVAPGTPPILLEAINFNGSVEGWSGGGDLWWRAPLNERLSFPVLVRVDYSTKVRDGKGLLYPSGTPIKYESRERNFQVEAGGGLDVDFGKGKRIAYGIYYNYLESNRSFFYQFTDQKTDHTDYPLQKEHRVLFKVAGEREWCPTFTGRLGLNIFYGWVDEDYRFRETFGVGGFAERISTDGYHWGAVASLGGTIKLSRINLEPFINGGYQRLSVDGDGGFRNATVGLSMDKLREEWSVGAGFSIRY